MSTRIVRPAIFAVAIAARMAAAEAAPPPALVQPQTIQSNTVRSGSALNTDSTRSATMATNGSSPATVGKKLHVVLDAGHGGVDKGATRGKIRESHIALAVVREIATLLRADPRFEVTLTRDRDEALTLAERADIAQRVRADLFVSVHCNASEDPRAHGVEFYFQNQMPADEDSLFLASRENQNAESDAEPAKPSRDERLSRRGDVAHIIEDLQRNYRISASHDLSLTFLANWHAEQRRRNRNAIRQAPFFLVSEVTIPSVLVELGFISHGSESSRLSDPEHQKLMARNLYDGLAQFKSALDKDRGR